MTDIEAAIQEFGLPEIPPCKKYINDFFTLEILAITKCKDGHTLNASEISVLKEAIEYYKQLFPILKQINLTTIDLERAQLLMKYLHHVFNILLIQQKDYQFHFLYRVTIVKDEDRKAGKIREPDKLSYPPLKIIQEKQFFNRCSTSNSTLFYASFYKNVALMEMEPEKGKKIIISKWQNPFPEKKYTFFEIPNADVNNLKVIEAKESYKKHLEGKDPLYQELLNLTTTFIASEFTKEISTKKERNPNRLEYIYSAFISDRLLKPPPQNNEITSNDLILYPSVEWKHKQENVAVDPKVHKLFKLVSAVEYEVGDTYYDKNELGLKEMPADLKEIRRSWGITNNDIIWDDD